MSSTRVHASIIALVVVGCRAPSPGLDDATPEPIKVATPALAQDATAVAPEDSRRTALLVVGSGVSSSNRRLAAVALVLVVAKPAAAYVQDRTRATGAAVHWAEPRVRLLLERATIPRGLSQTAVLSALGGAAERWNEAAMRARSRVHFEVVLGTQAAPKVADDGVSRVIFRSDRWARNGDPFGRYDRRRLAVTSLFVNGEGDGSGAGLIRDADIELNAVYHRWRADDDGALSGLASTLLHELGHVLGLAHTCDDGSRGDLTSERGEPVPSCTRPSTSLARARRTAMFPQPLRERDAGLLSLSDDERAALAAIYPR